MYSYKILAIKMLLLFPENQPSVFHKKKKTFHNTSLSISPLALLKRAVLYIANARVKEVRVGIISQPFPELCLQSGNKDYKKGSEMRREQQQHGHQHGLLGLGFQRGMLRREGMGALRPPKGWIAIRVGKEGREQQRFLVPVGYLGHPLFVGLLKEAEEEYGFKQKGAITIPCDIGHFLHVQDVIDRDNSCRATASSSAVHHHHPLNLICFRALS